MFSKNIPSVVGTCLLGLVFAHHPMILSGFDGIQINHEDPRLINFLLEHSYQWILGHPLHRDVWSPPFFYPATGTLAYSDSLLSAGPLYWPWRLVGVPADTSFQIWLVTCFALNDLLFFFLLRRIFGLSPWPSALGTFLFAFAASRVTDIGHPQLLPHFFTILAILALSEIMLNGAKWSDRARFLLWTLAGLAVAAQLYASFYLGWFLIIASIVMFLYGLIMPDARLVLLERTKRDWLLVILAGIVASVPTLVLFVHYLAAAKETGYRSFTEVFLAVPKLSSWLYMGPHSWLYSWLTHQQGFVEFGSLEAAHRIGVGWITPIACLTGLAWGWNRPSVRLFTMTGFTLFVIATRIPRWSIDGLALSAWMACPFAILSKRIQPPERVLAVLVYASLFWLLCPLMALLPVIVLLALWFLLARRLSPEQRLRIEKPMAMGICLFPAIPSFFDSPLALLSGSLGATGIVLAQRRSASRERSWTPLLLVPAVLAFAILPNISSELNLWKFVYAYVPGGAAIRVSSRICLLLLVPLAVGFAHFWQSQAFERRPRLLIALALFCILEQGMTTTTYSKRDARKRVGEIANSLREAQGSETFFYSSARHGPPDWNDHLDAMWAGLEVGLPSINGYSGHSPQGWYPLYDSAVRTAGDESRVRKALQDWIRLKGLEPNSVMWSLAGPGRSAPYLQTVNEPAPRSIQP